MSAFQSYHEERTADSRGDAFNAANGRRVPTRAVSSTRPAWFLPSRDSSTRLHRIAPGWGPPRCCTGIAAGDGGRSSNYGEYGIPRSQSGPDGRRAASGIGLHPRPRLWWKNPQLRIPKRDLPPADCSHISLRCRSVADRRQGFASPRPGTHAAPFPDAATPARAPGERSFRRLAPQLHLTSPGYPIPENDLLRAQPECRSETAL